MTTDDLHRIWLNHDWRLNKRSIKEALIIGGILGIIAPYNTSEVTVVVWRFLYWIILVFFASAVSGLVARAIIPKMIEKSVPFFPALALYTTILAFPITLAVLALDICISALLVSPDGLSWRHVYATLGNVPDGALGYIYLYGQVWVLAVLITGIVALVDDKLLASKAPKPTMPAGYKFLKRLSPEMGKDLVCLSMEDHYIRAHTRKGDALILMRMADALSELEDYSGIQTHRSWWVATDAIESVAKEGRKYIVQLHGGLTAPVSQTHQNKLKDLGFI